MTNQTDTQKSNTSRKPLSEITEGERLTDYIVHVRGFQELESSGTKFMKLDLGDKTETVGSVLFKPSKVLDVIKEKLTHREFILLPHATLKLYQGNRQLDIASADFLNDDMYLTETQVGDSREFLTEPMQSETDEKAFEMYIRQLVEHLDREQHIYGKLLRRVFFNEDNTVNSFYQDFVTAPGAQGVHHAYTGGLLDHSLNVSTMAGNLATQYGNKLGEGRSIDTDVVTVSAILHDVGKVGEYEYSYGRNTTRTQLGSLYGHIVLGLFHLREVVRDMGREGDLTRTDENNLDHLLHIVASHHGKIEYGSPVLPQTVEALLVSQADKMDADMGILQKEISSLPNEATKTGRIRYLDNREFILKWE